MKEPEMLKIEKTLSKLITILDAQGENVKSFDEPNYGDLMISELYVTENLSTKYKEELRIISKFVRRYLWRNVENENSEELYTILHQINLVMKTFSDILTEDTFWNLDIVMQYAMLLYKYRDSYASQIEVSDQDFEFLIDQIEMENAKKIIKKQWEDVLDASDGLKTFMKVFDDAFTQAITKYDELFFHRMSNSDILCRMVQAKDCNEDRFIPKPEYARQNRWNPPGKAFLYMSFGDKEHNYNYNEDITIEEYICLIECRTKEETYCSFCRFEPTKEGRVLDLSYNDVQLCTYRQMLCKHADELSQKGIEKLLSDDDVLIHRDDKEYVKRRIKEVIMEFPLSDRILTESVVKQYLKLICSAIYTKVDGTEAEKEKAYKPFHILSEYLESKGVTGIIYPCTRSDKIIGKNIVLFNPDDARPIRETIKRYYYRG